MESNDRAGEGAMFRLQFNGFVRKCIVLLSVAVAACGGGGSSTPAPTVVASFSPQVLNASTLEGSEGRVSFSAFFTATGIDTFYVRLSEQQNVVVDANTGSGGGNVMSGSLTLSSTLPAGVYNTQLVLTACADTECKTVLGGGPMSVPIRYEVKPQIKIGAAQPMRRVGREPAPTQSIPFTVPTEAGAVSVSAR
jgi:hypothetical protein